MMIILLILITLSLDSVYMDIVRRKLLLVTIGILRVNPFTAMSGLSKKLRKKNISNQFLSVILHVVPLKSFSKEV